MGALAAISALMISLRGQTLVETGRAQILYDFSQQRPLTQKPPLWSGGALIVVDSNNSAGPVIRSFDDNGVELARIEFTIPGANVVHVRGVARGTDGTYGVCGRAFDSNGHGSGFVSWVPPDRKAIKTTQTLPYIPNIITMAPDRTLWTEGLETDQYGNQNSRLVDRSHGVIRHFDTNARQIGSFMRRSGFTGNRYGLIYGFIVSNKDRIGWYAQFAHRYFELSFDGTVKSYPGVAPPNSNNEDVLGMAMTESGEVVASAVTYEPGRSVMRVYRLDRSGNTWAPVRMPFDLVLPYGGLLLGGDGNRLAFVGASLAEIRFLNLTD